MGERIPDGLQGGWSCVFGVVAMVAVVLSPQLLDVVWRSPGVVVVTVAVAVVVVVVVVAVVAVVAW